MTCEARYKRILYIIVANWNSMLVLLALTLRMGARLYGEEDCERNLFLGVYRQAGYLIFFWCGDVPSHRLKEQSLSSMS